MTTQHEQRKKKWEECGDSVGNYRIVCVYCNKEAFKRHPTAKYCGIDCQEKHRYEKIKAAKQLGL